MASIGGAGCGEEPDEDDLLTLVDVQAVGDVELVPGEPAQVAAAAEVTFRDWFNGGVVVELRVSSALAPGELGELLAGQAVDRALAWEQVMAASVGAGLSSRAIVGYPGLIREPVFELEVGVPSMVDGEPVQSAFLVGYLADVEEEEVAVGVDTLIVTPYGAGDGILNDAVDLGLGGAP